MEKLIAQLRRIPNSPLRNVSDALLLSILSETKPYVDRVNSGVILFEEDGINSCWYLLLSGLVELYHSHSRLKVISPGWFFGELNASRHSCSAKILGTAEFIRVPRDQLLDVYCKHADHLQSFIVATEDLVQQDADMTVEDSEQFMKNNNTVTVPDDDNIGYIDDVASNQNGYDEVARERGDWQRGAARNELNLFELGKPPFSPNSRMREIALLVKGAMERILSENTSYFRPIHPSAADTAGMMMMNGAEMVELLALLLRSTFKNGMRGLISRLSPPSTTTTATTVSIRLTEIWQLLLDGHHIRSGIIYGEWVTKNFEEGAVESSVKNDPFFNPTRGSLYAWTVDSTDVAKGLGDFEQPSLLDLKMALLILERLSDEHLLYRVLGKPPSKRTSADLEYVAGEMKHIKALSHLSASLKRELAPVLRIEEYQHAGYVLEDFRQGEEGHCWFIILRGGVNVVVAGKGIVCALSDGDDFGKLALVSDAPRAASVILADENCRFLRIDKYDFNRALEEVEANSIRLKDSTGEDVLVLERVELPPTCGLGPDESVDLAAPIQSVADTQYSVMAGMPEKILEYLLETRIDSGGLSDSEAKDELLEDFILTHLMFMPSNQLCNFLKRYCNGGGERDWVPSGMSPWTSRVNNGRSLFPTMNPLHTDGAATKMKRVVKFLVEWQRIFGVYFYADPVINSFLDELYCSMLSTEGQSNAGMQEYAQCMAELRRKRELAMELLARPPKLILDCGVYSASAPAPSPIFAFDTSNQCVHFCDTTFVTLPVKMDRTAEEIVEMARGRAMGAKWPHSTCRLPNSDNVEASDDVEDNCLLVEVKSNGERVVFSSTEISIPTMLSLNGKLYVVFKGEVDGLTALPEQNQPPHGVAHTSVLNFLSAEELSRQLKDFHMDLLEATSELELLIQVVGRDRFAGRSPSNLDILLRRFHEVQYWTSSEILLASNTPKRLNVLRKFIVTAMISMENRDLLSLFAITLGLSNVAISRLDGLWMRLDPRLHQAFTDFENLLDPSNDHRAYRLLSEKLAPPSIPFVPLLLKDLAFLHESNKTMFTGSLMNFSKMSMVAGILKRFHRCKPTSSSHPPCLAMKPVSQIHAFIRNFYVIDNQAKLMALSYEIEPLLADE